MGDSGSQSQIPSSFSVLENVISNYACLVQFANDVSRMDRSSFIDMVMGNKMGPKIKRDRFMQARFYLFEALKEKYNHFFLKFGDITDVDLIVRPNESDLKLVYCDIHALCCSLQEDEITSDALIIITRRMFKQCADGKVDINFCDELSSGAVFNDLAKIIQNQGEWSRAHADAESKQIAQLSTELAKLSYRFEKMEKQLFKYSDIVKNSSNSNIVNNIGGNGAKNLRESTGGAQQSRSRHTSGAKRSGSPLVGHVGGGGEDDLVCLEGDATKRMRGQDDRLVGRSVFVSNPSGSHSGSMHSCTTPQMAASQSNTKRVVLTSASKINNTPHRSASRSDLRNKPAKNSRPQRSTIIGSKSHENLRAAPRFHLYYTGRWQAGTSCDEIRTYLKDIGIEVKSCQKNIMQHEKFVSFRFECEERYASIAKDPGNWPIGVTLGRWFAPKSTRVEQTNQATSRGNNNNSRQTALTQSGQDSDMPQND